MNPTTRLQQQQREQEQQSATGQLQSVPEQSALEFATPEEALRHDTAQTLVPPAVAERLQKSIQQEPPPPRPWWRRWRSGPSD